VQYYQYARFEYWPDDPNGNVVHLGNIGAELQPATVIRTNSGSAQKLAYSNANAEVAQMSKAWLPLDKSTGKKANTATWAYVAATRHTVSNGFKTFWDASGGINYFRCESAEVNALLDTTVETGDTAGYVEAGDLYGRTGCYLNLSHNKDWVVAQKWLTGVAESHNIGANELDFSLLGIAK